MMIMMARCIYKTLAGWWFGPFFIFPYIGNFIIPTDFHIFQRCWNHQPAWMWSKELILFICRKGPGPSGLFGPRHRTSRSVIFVGILSNALVLLGSRRGWILAVSRGGTPEPVSFSMAEVMSIIWKGTRWKHGCLRKKWMDNGTMEAFRWFTIVDLHLLCPPVIKHGVVGNPSMNIHEHLPSIGWSSFLLKSPFVVVLYSWFRSQPCFMTPEGPNHSLVCGLHNPK